MRKRKIVSIGLVLAMLLTLFPMQFSALASNSIYSGNGFEIQYKVTSQWSGAQNLQMTLKNTGSVAMNNWAVGFYASGSAESPWSAAIGASKEGYCLIENAGWNAKISAGGSMTFGFTLKTGDTFNPERFYIGDEARNPPVTPTDPDDPIIDPDDPIIDWDNLDENDDDEDGLPNWMEDYFGTDKNNPDTDGDGLPDGYEVLTLGSDPLTPDGDLDFDEDGLSNIEEYTLGTDPWNTDTDDDGLSDYDEVYTYGTDPLNPDTDEDGLLDKTEITIGLDPLNPDTDGNGVIDGEEITTQPVDLRYEEDSQVIPSVEITGKGDFGGTLTVENISENPAVATLPYLVGEPFDFKHGEELDFESSRLRFTLSDDILEECDISDLAIAYFNTEDGSVTLIDSYPVGGNAIEAIVSHYSVYVVVNKMQYLASWNALGDTRLVIDEKYKSISGYYNGNIYALIENASPSSITWMTAKAFCETLGGHLVTITSAGEQAFVEQELYNKSLKNSYWLGGSDAERDGDWHWVTGEPWSYTNWGGGQPDNGYDGLEDYLGFWRGPQWNDFTNDAGFTISGLICEWEQADKFRYPVKLSSGETIWLDKDPAEGDHTVDTDGDGLCDLDELTTGYKYWINGTLVTVWNYKSRPDMADSDGDGLLDNEDLRPLIYDDDRAQVYIGGYGYAVDTDDIDSVLKMLRAIDDGAHCSGFSGTTIQVYNFQIKAPVKFTYTKGMAVKTVLNHAGIYAGPVSSLYYQKRYDSLTKKNAYYVTVPNKYRHHLGITEDGLADCLETMNDIDWLFLSNTLDFGLDFLDIWHILYVYKTYNNGGVTHFLTYEGRAKLEGLNLGNSIINGVFGLDDAWNLANSGLTWANMEQAYKDQFARNYDMLMGYLALACISALNNVYKPPVRSGGSIWDKGKQVYDKFDVDNAYVKPKHLSITGGDGAKFLGNSKVEAENILKEAMRRGDIKTIVDNGLTTQGNHSYQIIIDAGKTIGTRGERLVILFLSDDGGMLSAYPFR